MGLFDLIKNAASREGTIKRGGKEVNVDSDMVDRAKGMHEAMKKKHGDDYGKKLIDELQNQ